MLENRWEGIDEFVAVAECSQFTAAAERLLQPLQQRQKRFRPVRPAALERRIGVASLRGA